MFVLPERWSVPDAGDPAPCFRQGDLVRLEWIWANPSPVAKRTHSGEAREVRGIEVRTEIVGLLSACCDLVDRKPPKRKGVLISPLRSIPDNIRKSADLFRALKMRAVDAAEQKVPVPANLFFYEAVSDSPEGVIHLECMAMVEFSALVKASKIAELTEDARAEMQERIKFHFTRREK